MLSTVINAYLYEQYADDDDLQAFVTAYNQMAQVYVSWFATVGLPIYTGLSGSLLDWVANGLYGTQRTSIASPPTAALGLLNTELLNTDVVNGYTLSTQTFYALSDDAFQRILTWNLYKGDRKRFGMRWLKRRIMRFLLGHNGTDPQPNQSSFQIGAENTQAISVVVQNHVLTVTIYEVLLSRYAQITPYILQIFQAAFLSRGVLDLPVQYTYQCNIVAPLTVIIIPQIVTATGTSTGLTTGQAHAQVFAGSGVYTYAWSVVSPTGSNIQINTPTMASTSFTLTSGAIGQTYTGLFQCLVTDTVTSQTATATCQVMITTEAVQLLTQTGFPILTQTNGVAGPPLLLG